MSNITNLASEFRFMDNIIEVNFAPHAERRSTSLYTSSGKPKASAADPIRSLADIKAMQNYYRNKGQIRNYAIFTVGIMFGLRAGDLLSLRLHHIFNPDMTFKTHCDVIESKTRKSNNPMITEQMRALITNYLDSLPTKPGYHDPLFMSNKREPDGSRRPISISYLNRVLKEAAKACNVPGHISSHSLRKTFVYQMLKANPNDDNAKFAVQKMLNHNEFKTTLTYCGMAQDAIDQYRAGLESVII